MARGWGWCPPFERYWYEMCVCVAALAAATLALLWAALVPMFQAPDESDHYAYAYAMRQAGGMLRVEGGVVADDPRIATAEDVIAFHRVQFRSSQPAPPDYGAPSFFVHLDERVARVPAVDYRAPGTARPEMAAVYPPGGYLPYALAVATGRTFSGSFFAARAASVAMTALSIALWGFTLRRSGVRPVVALFVLAVAAVFPLTAFVGSYVQPDNVAAVMVPLVLLIALRIRDGRTSTATLGAYGLALAFTSAVKLQFWLPLAAATLPLAAGAGRRRLPALLAWTVVPLGAAILWSAWAMGGARTNYFSGNNTLTSAFVEAAHGGSRSAAGYVVRETTAAWTDFVGGGTTSATFWGDFGWVDAPIDIVDPEVSAALRRCEATGSAIAVALFAIALARTSRRLVAVARRRSTTVSFRLALRNAPLNAYVIFAALMTGIYVTSANLFGAQGRNWYPFLPVAFLVAVRYAPAAFPPGRLRHATAWAVAAFLGLYAIAGAVYGLTTVEDRYYTYRPAPVLPDPERIAVLSRPPTLYVDLARIDSIPVSRDRIFRVAGRHRILLDGWAADLVRREPCGALYAALDGHLVAWARYGAERPDVARATGDPALLHTGYHVEIPAAALLPQPQDVTLNCLDAQRGARYAAVRALRAVRPS